MMLQLAFALALGVPGAQAAAPQQTATAPRPEARPFGHPERAAREVDAAFARAKANGHRVMLVFGTNPCSDSRALAGWFGTPRFAPMLAKRYEIVWIEVGKKDTNIDLARRFGLSGITGTPTVLIVDAATGVPTNLSEAPNWHNAGTRSEDAIYSYFEGAAR